MTNFLNVNNFKSVFVLGFLIVSMDIGCMPKSMQVQTGSEPRYEDDDTRWTGAYYIRVLEYCNNEQESNNENINGKPVLKDNLFRFIMKGKGSSLWNKIQFESGFVHKSAIDPFGALVTYDPESRQYRYKSKQEIENNRRKQFLKDVDDEFEQLIKLNERYFKVAKLSSTDTSNKMDFGESGRKLKKFLEKRAESLNSSFDKNPSPTTSSSSLCNDDNSVTKDVYVLGPEGSRKLDPDERLVLSMSSSGKPLVSAMKKLSGIILNEKSNRSRNREIISEEQSRIFEVLRKVNHFKTNKSSQVIVGEILKYLSSSEAIKYSGE